MIEMVVMSWSKNYVNEGRDFGLRYSKTLTEKGKFCSKIQTVMFVIDVQTFGKCLCLGVFFTLRPVSLSLPKAVLPKMSLYLSFLYWLTRSSSMASVVGVYHWTLLAPTAYRGRPEVWFSHFPVVWSLPWHVPVHAWPVFLHILASSSWMGRLIGSWVSGKLLVVLTHLGVQFLNGVFYRIID